MHGFFDWRNIVVASTLCREGDVIVEVGANVGTETISFLDIVGQSGRVLALEPDPNLIERLLRNLSNANTTTLKLLNLAAGDTPGRMAFHTTSNSTSSGTGHLVFGTEPPRGSDLIDVEVVRLDDVLDDCARVDLIAIDVEGAEERCLRGTLNTIRRFRPFLIVEASEENLRKAGSTPRALKNLIESESYFVAAIGRFGLTSTDSISGDCNWLAIPIEQKELAERIDNAILKAGLLPFRMGFSKLRD